MYKRFVMKKLSIILFLLVAVPSMAFAENPAPYTDEALQQLIQATHETSKVVFDKEAPQEDYLRQLVEYYTTIFEKAGYSYYDTIDKIVFDKQNNPEAIPADRETVYNKIYIQLHLLMNQCELAKVDCLQFYPHVTGESIQWLIENSGFKAHQGAVHGLSK